MYPLRPPSKNFSLNTFIQNNLRFVYNLSFNKWYVDEIYQWILNKIIMPVYNATWYFVDKIILDGVFVNGSAKLAALVGGSLRLIETGRAQFYALVIFGSVLFAVLFMLKRMS